MKLKSWPFESLGDSWGEPCGEWPGGGSGVPG
jgi:hypothetical protein